MQYLERNYWFWQMLLKMHIVHFIIAGNQDRLYVRNNSKSDSSERMGGPLSESGTQRTYFIVLLSCSLSVGLQFPPWNNWRVLGSRDRDLLECKGWRPRLCDLNWCGLDRDTPCGLVQVIALFHHSGKPCTPTLAMCWPTINAVPSVTPPPPTHPKQTHTTPAPLFPIVRQDTLRLSLTGDVWEGASGSTVLDGFLKICGHHFKWEPVDLSDVYFFLSFMEIGSQKQM